MTEWVTFDCYGTLIDWERGIEQTMQRLWPNADTNALLDRYHNIEPRVQEGSSASYRSVLSEVLDLLAQAEGLELPGNEVDALARSLPEWPPFDDAPGALRELRASGRRMAILSNTDPDLLAASVSNIGVPFELLITAAEARSYKPASGHWERFFADTGADRADHVHVAASIFHDISPARRLGLRAIWINRKDETSDVPREHELSDLSGLLEAIDGG